MVSSDLGLRSMASSCEHYNESFGSLKGLTNSAAVIFLGRTVYYEVSYLHGSENDLFTLREGHKCAGVLKLNSSACV